MENLNNLYQWMDFIVNKKDVFLNSDNCHLQIFNEDDNSYLVINVYSDNTHSTEYYFQPSESENKLMSLVLLLGHFDFSLKKLIKTLPKQNYIEGDMGCYLEIANIRIFKEDVMAN